MPSRSLPRFQRSYLDPPTVSLTPALAARLHAPGLDPEAILLAKESPIHQSASGAVLDLSALYAQDALAIEWWLLGLTMLEVAAWMGVCKQRVHQRIKRGVQKLRETRD